MQSWLHADPLIGEGNGTVKVTAEAHSGRLQRTSDINFRADTDQDNPIVRTVIQEGRPEFVELLTQKIVTVNSALGGNIEASVKSNAALLSVNGLPIWLKLLSGKYTIGDSAITPGSDIPGDPGATAAYQADFTIQCAANTTPKVRTAVITIKGEEALVSMTIRQVGAALIMNVTPDTVELGYDGSDEGTFSVTSNDDWIVD